MPASRVVTKFADLEAVTASRVLVSDANGYATTSAITTTILEYLDDTTSRIDLANYKLISPVSNVAMIDWGATPMIYNEYGDEVFSIANGTLRNHVLGTPFDALGATGVSDSSTNEVLAWAQAATGVSSSPRLDVSNVGGDAANIVMRLKAANTQSGNLLEFIQFGGGQLAWFTQEGGFVLNGTAAAGSCIINENASADVDFRVEGDTATHLLFTDASADAIGVNDSAPAAGNRGQVSIIERTSAVGLSIKAAGTTPGDLLRLLNSSDSIITYFDSNAGLIGNETGGTTADLRWEGDTETHLLFVDASVDGIGIASSSVDSACYMQFPTSASLARGLRVPTWTGASSFDAAPFVGVDAVAQHENPVTMPGFTAPAGTMIYDDVNNVLWVYNSGSTNWRGVYLNIVDAS